VGLSGFSVRRFLSQSVPAATAWSATYITIYLLAAASLREGSGLLVPSAGLAMLGFTVFGAAYLMHFLIERSHQHVTEPEEA
jgi:membrane protein DedA with SNARE-associated domain